MNNKGFYFSIIFIFLLFVNFSHSKEPLADLNSQKAGYLEVECNIAGVPIYSCPKSNYEKKEIKIFFGLLSDYKNICTKGKLSLGVTPIASKSIPSGKYVLMVPEEFVLEKKGNIEIEIKPEEKLYYLLKLFVKSESEKGNGGGGGVAGGGGGGGSGGVAGGGAP